MIGKDSSQYFNGYKYEDTVFGLDPITKSDNILEIRFYNLPSESSVSWCTILYYDSTLKMRRIKHQIAYDTLSHITSQFNQQEIVNGNADSILNKLVENGVFSLGSSVNHDSLVKKEIERFKKLALSSYIKEDLKRYYIPNVKELTKHGLKDGSYTALVNDGISFRLEFKVGKTFNSIFIGNPVAYFKHNPDQQTYRRKYEIGSLMLVDLSK